MGNESAVRYSECEIQAALHLIANGLSDRDIARLLCILGP